MAEKVLDEKKELPKEVEKVPESKIPSLEDVKKRIDSFKKDEGKEVFEILLRDIKTAQGKGKSRRKLHKEYIAKYEAFYDWFLDRKKKEEVK